MKTKIIVGITIGFIAAGMLWLAFQQAWIGYLLGLVCIFAGIAVLKARKIISCMLASTLAVSPNVMADFSAGFSGEQCYCPAADMPEQEEHAIVLSFIIHDGDPRILDVRQPAVAVDYATFNRSLAAWGIDLDGPLQYATNGQPATAADVPFSFRDGALSIYPGREQFNVVIETASELNPEFTFWQSVIRFSAPADVRIDVQDSPEGAQAFYRVRLTRAPEAFQPQGAVLLGCGIGLLVGTAVISVLAVRQCAKNRKKFQEMLPPQKTNDVDQVQPPE